MALAQDKSLLKLITCGSVDDGKSTLIGHMLYDAKMVFADQAQALELESRTKAGGGLDYSLLLDGLAAEREQGITIDVAYRYFATPARSFIVADAPGHVEYTRNMAVGASFADLAVMLVDATKGLLTQTYRHMRICSLAGIRDFVFAVNKMDLVGYDEDVFARIAEHIDELAGEFEVSTFRVIPVSATQGDNLTGRSGAMPWYSGPALLGYLEDVEIMESTFETGFTMPVQRVCRPDASFRGFQGTIATGTLRAGDAVTILPSKTNSCIASIFAGADELEQACAGQAVTVTLTSEVDVSRGSVLVRDSLAKTGSFFTVKLLWMDDSDLLAGKNFLFKLGTQTVPGTVLKIRHWIDAETGDQIPATRVRKNEIAECDISLSEKIVYERFDENRTLGSMILIDRLTCATAAAAVIERTILQADYLTWHEMEVNRALRESHMGQRALTLWFTGLSGSGKSTLADAVESKLHALGRYTMLLDGDNVRLGLNRNLGFSEADRIENIRRIAEVSKLMNDAGLIVLTSFISPFLRDRRSAAEIIGEDGFVEIYVSTPLAVCEQRDVKGLYAKARRGEIADFTGVSSPYEAPAHPDIVCDTSAEDIEACAKRIVDFVLGKVELT